MRHLAHTLIVIASLFAGTSTAGDTLTQISTIGALLSGIYDGQTPLSSLSRNGDFGIGTFNGLDGEMVFVNDTFFRIAASGAVSRPAGETATPFAAVTFFHPGRPVDLVAGSSMKSVELKLDSMIPTLNQFYAIRISGTFRNLKVRSVPRQERPYRPLREVVKEQSVFTLDSIRGTIVGFRCPAYTSAISVAGYHLHFLSADRSHGGHLLDFTADSCRAETDRLGGLKLLLPNDSAFYRANLSGTTDADVKKVER